MAKRDFPLTKIQEEQLIEVLQTYFAEHFEPISHLQAYLLLDFLCDQLGPTLYNLALEDAYQYWQDRLQDMFVLQK